MSRGKDIGFIPEASSNADAATPQGALPHAVRKIIADVLNARRQRDPYTPVDADDLLRRLVGEVRIPIKDGLDAAGGDEPDNAKEFVRRWPDVPAIQQDAAAVLIALLSDGAGNGTASTTDASQALRDEHQTATGEKG